MKSSVVGVGVGQKKNRHTLATKHVAAGVILLITCTAHLLFFSGALLSTGIPSSEESVHRANAVRVDKDVDVARLMVVPFDAYIFRASDKITEHRSCEKTIIVRKQQPDWKDNDKPFAEINYSDVKDLFLKPKEDMLCLQVGSTATVGAMVITSSSNKKTDHVSLLRSDAAELVVDILERQSSNDLELDIVERKTVVLFPGYSIGPGAVAERVKNDNSGNFMWSFGATRMINPYTTVFISHDSETGIESASALVMASANAFHLEPKNTNAFNAMKNYVNALISIVRKIDKPTILLGIGIQAKFADFEDGNKPMKLYEHQLLLLNEIGKRNQASTSVSVRGDFTHTAAINAGANNTISLGCPSLTISRRSNLGDDLEKKWNRIKSLPAKSSLKIGIGLPAISYTDPDYERIVSGLLTMCEPHDCYFILQMGYDRSQLLKLAGETVNKDKILFFREGVEDWLEFVRGLDILVSTRIHGGMVGISTGTPTIILPTDFRITELVNAMKLPHIPFEKAKNTKFDSLSEVMAATENDFFAFEANRRNRLKEYKRMLESVGLGMDPALLEIIDDDRFF